VAFVAYCERQDWIPAFYQVDDVKPYRAVGMTAVPIGSEALIEPSAFTLSGKDKRDLRYAVRRCERAGIRIAFMSGPEAWSALEHELRAVSGRWLRSRGGEELRYSLGTLATLRDPQITVGVAVSATGRLEAFVSWLPVLARGGWTLDLMRRRPDSEYGVMEALLVRSIAEAASRGITELSLGLVPVPVRTRGVEEGAGGWLKAMYWSVSRFQRGRTLHLFKEKIGPRWEDRYLAVPNALVLPEVLVALARAHLPRMLPARQAWRHWPSPEAGREIPWAKRRLGQG